MEIEKIKITDIVPAEYNPRTISTEELTKLKNSINEFGLVDPIIINLKNNKIIGGHQRYEVLINEHMLNGDFYGELNLIRMGDVGWIFTETDLTIQDEDHEKALNLALNKISGEWDFEKLGEILDDLAIAGFDIELTGFEDLEINNELGFFNDDFEDETTDGGYDENFDNGFIEAETHQQQATFELNEDNEYSFFDYFNLKINKDFIEDKIRIVLYQDTMQISFDCLEDEDLLKRFVEDNIELKDNLRNNGKFKSDIYG